MLQDVGGVPAVSMGGNGWGGDGCGSWMGMLLVIALLGGGFGGFGRRDGFDGHRGGDCGCDRAFDLHHDSNMHSQFNDTRNEQRHFDNLNEFRTLERNQWDNEKSVLLQGERLQGAIKDCCCNTQLAVSGSNNDINRNIDQLRFNGAMENKDTLKAIGDCCCATSLNNERNTNAIIQNATANTQRILDRMCADEQREAYMKINELERLNSEARIVAAMKPIAPVPAYIQPSPYQHFYPNFGFNHNNCGCDPCRDGFRGRDGF